MGDHDILNVGKVPEYSNIKGESCLYSEKTSSNLIEI